MHGTLVHLSDLHLGRGPAEAVALRHMVSAILAARVDQVVVTGDVTDHGRLDELATFRRLTAPIADRLTVVPGNHDRLGEDAGRRLMSGRVAGERRPGLHLVRLDSTAPHNRRLLDSHGLVTAADLDAVEAALSGAGPRDLVAVLHLDAHLDTSGPEVWGEAFHHGTPFRHAVEEGLVLPGQLHQVGIRGPWGTAGDGDLGAEHGASLVTPDQLAAAGADAVARAVRQAVGDRPLYLSLDVDVLDPAFAPGTGTPVPGGLTSRELLALLRGLAGVRLVGMDVVEVCPALDHADLTCHLAAHLLFEGLALAALARG